MGLHCGQPPFESEHTWELRLNDMELSPDMVETTLREGVRLIVRDLRTISAFDVRLEISRGKEETLHLSMMDVAARRFSTSNLHDDHWYCTITTSRGSASLFDASWHPETKNELLYRFIDHVQEVILEDLWGPPWPPCPVHLRHPLYPSTQDRGGYWVCKQDLDVSIELGSLSIL